ncbi:MAG: Ig-like domain-containing protein, partial [Paracoccaceae bacterium]|nr:Ig-like domain-containing protein [Paracoccaceae bacterium]
MVTPQQLITQYIAYFNRAPDPDGYAFWLFEVQARELGLVELARIFSESDEAREIYPLLGTPGFLTEARVENFLGDVYQNLFNRDLDGAGRDFYVPRILDGRLAVEQAIAQIINGAKGGDEQVLSNKAAAAQYFFTTLADVPGFEYLDPDGTPNAEAEALARSVVADADGTPESVDAARVDVDAFVAQLANQAPTAVNDTALASEDDPLTVPATGVLTNDTDPEGGTLTVTAVNGVESDVGTLINLASGARLTLNADGSYTYDPNGKFEDLTEGQFETDTFEYTVSDEFGASDTATVTVKIEGKADENTFTLTENADIIPGLIG